MPAVDSTIGFSADSAAAAKKERHRELSFPFLSFSRPAECTDLYNRAFAVFNGGIAEFAHGNFLSFNFVFVQRFYIFFFTASANAASVIR